MTAKSETKGVAREGGLPMTNDIPLGRTDVELVRTMINLRHLHEDLSEGHVCPAAYVYLCAASGDGIETKKEIARAWCRLRQLNLAAYFIDADCSTDTLFDERPQGAELSKRLRPGDHVVLPRIECGFRNEAESLATVEKWVKAGVVVDLCELGIDTRSPYWLQLPNLMSAFA